MLLLCDWDETKIGEIKKMTIYEFLRSLNRKTYESRIKTKK